MAFFKASLVLCSVLGQCLASHVPSQEPLNPHVSSAKLLLKDDLVPLLENLTNIESISGNEKKVGNWLASSLEAQGYKVEKQSVEHHPARFNLLAWPGSQKDAPILVTSHIDTVPPFYPFKRHHDGDDKTVSGRGTVDDKGSVATQIVAVNELITSGELDPDDVAFLFVVGEEDGGDGMRAANDLDLHPKTIIFGEPTEEKLVSGHKGIILLSIETKGQAAHSGYPWLGRSANEVLISALTPLITLGDHLPKSDKYGITTLNIGRMEGGVAKNVIAKSAHADIAVRIAEGTPEMIKESIIKAIHYAVRDFLEGEMEPEEIIEITFSSAGYGPIDIDHDVPGLDSMTVNYGTDIPWLNKTVKDQKRYLYGPGSIFVAHSDHEALNESQLYDAVEGYQKIILHALGKDE